MQKKLDEVIERKVKKGLTLKDIKNKKVVALLVEVGELANEMRSFKFWSRKKANDKEFILEEYVDCMHFILGIGNDYSFDHAVDYYKFEIQDYLDETDALFYLYDRVIKFKNNPSVSTYLDIWDAFLQVGYIIGFSMDEIEKAYMRKNRINFERQESGY